MNKFKCSRSQRLARRLLAQDLNEYIGALYGLLFRAIFGQSDTTHTHTNDKKAYMPTVLDDVCLRRKIMLIATCECENVCHQLRRLIHIGF